MLKIDREQNRIMPLEVKSFTELGFRERAHLQEWIAENPTACLGEDLLIIQKEFAEFSDTKERIDLLALDKSGALVIIENKLDDTGRDVTWQALKYASYCSGLNKDNIRRIYQTYLDKYFEGQKAEDNLVAFFEAEDYEDIVVNKSVSQRVILIAANFRKEVTSTVLWLMSFKLRIQCFKATPFAMGEDLFLNIEQIIPTRDTEEFMMGLAQKAQDEISEAAQEQNRHSVRRRFWSALLNTINEQSEMFRAIGAGTASYIGVSTGVAGVRYNFVATQNSARVEVYIGRSTTEENKAIFDSLMKNRKEIEKSFSGELIWERLDNKSAARIKAEAKADIFDEEQWPEMIEFMVDAMLRLQKAFYTPLRAINGL